MSRQEDIHVGLGTVTRHTDGGWALPGGGAVIGNGPETVVNVTHDRAEATAVATQLDVLITAGLTRRPDRRVAVTKPVVTRRAAGEDSHRWGVSA